MMYFIRTRTVAQTDWVYRGTMHAKSANRACLNARKLLKLTKSTQVQALSEGYADRRKNKVPYRDKGGQCPGYF